MDQEDFIHVPESPLIPRFGRGIEFSGEQNKKWYSDSSMTIAELKRQARLGGPLVVVSFLQYSLQMISVMFVGHLGQLSLSSASMALSFAEVTGFSFLLGMGSALETFCGQAYGARQYHMLGVHMQRAMLVLMLTCIPIAVIWAFTGHIFEICGQDSEISKQAGIFACWLIPSIFPYALLQCQLGFLQTQNNVKPLMISTAITSLVHLLVCWTLVCRVGLGHKGAALSVAISYWVNVVILAIYIQFSPACQNTWTGFSKEGIKDTVGFLSVSIPSALMVCLEGWSYELLVLMSGLLPNPKLEASVMAIRIPLGFGSTVSTRVSNELGAGKPHAAKLAAMVVIFLVVTEGLLVSLISIAVRDKWGYVYTHEEEVVRYLASIMLLLAVSNFMDGIQAVLSGIARGCGWQKIGAFVNLGAYYLIGLPSAIILTFVFHFGVKGLWMGIMVGSCLQAVLFLAITLQTNWEHQEGKARDRVYASCIPTDTAI
ncbi:protein DETOXIFICATION 16-like isoform X2 [Actinidia eriantha]|uniref:protein DETOXIFICATION 16-like isoform X2 n=1 Tax=Actinidia eriantha TaxID=165200 RepID=UPI0025911551|nr:protein DETOXIFICATION 16-like isoform X2 [Actinidia eriantha]